MAKITTPNKITGDSHSAAEYNAFKTAINDLHATEETHTSVLTFDKNKFMSTSLSQSASINYTLATTGNVDGMVIRHKILSDGTNPITFSLDFNVFGKSDNDIYPAGLHIFYFNYVGGDVDVAIPTYSPSSTSTPTNTAPSSTADSYSVDENQVLTVAAPGVLANDSDADADSLTAILVTQATNGTVNLSADGSFTYTPNADYFGSDSFTYKTNDGTEDGNTATVTITVNEVVVPIAPYEYFGLYKHNTDYTGPCITVKADGGTIETDIGFDANGDLDTAAILAISDTARFRITKLYGQYNSTVLTQATESKMPVIMDAGVTIDMGGTETMYFSNSGGQLVGPTTMTAENGFTAVIIAGTTSSTNSNRGLFGKWGATAEYALLSHHFATPNNISVTSKNSSDVQTTSNSASTFPINQLNLISAVWGTDQYIRLNGTEIIRTSITGVRSHTNPFVLGGYLSDNTTTDVQLRVVGLLVYKSEVNPINDETELNTKYSIYA